MSTRKKVIVVGGGFAGTQMVRRLDENLFDVILIDKINQLRLILTEDKNPCVKYNDK